MTKKLLILKWLKVFNMNIYNKSMIESSKSLKYKIYKKSKILKK